MRWGRQSRLWQEAWGKPCPYCREPMVGPVNDPRAPTRDHLWPKSRGGRLAGDNRLVVCKGCNTDKAERSLIEWLALLMWEGDPRAAHVQAVAAALYGRLPECEARALVLGPARFIAQQPETGP